LDDRNEPRGFRWAGTAKNDVGTLGGNLSQAYSINGMGNVVGFSNNASGNSRAFLWNGSMRELEVLPGYQDSFANRLNNHNQVVGRVESKINSEIYNPLPNSQPFLWENGSIIGLGTLGGDFGEALGINDVGVVVGWSMVGEGTRAFIWDKNSSSGMVDLNGLISQDSGWILAAATGINNQGQIVGYGFQNGGSNEQAFLLTPLPQENPEEAFEVKIDIRPWNLQNRIHLQGRWSLIPIAILSDADFNALKDVDRRSLTFGRTGEEDSLAFCAPWKWDVNHDRKKDLVCYFHERPAGFQCGDTVGTLKGKTLKGEAFEAQDKVQVGLCPPPKKHHHKK
jgi:probable HAF family extracellular repeat protein